MKTKIIGFIAVVFAILFTSDVYAQETYNGSFYEAEKIDGIYFYKHREDTEEIKYQYHNFHSQAAIYRKTTDNKFVYCIESWEPISNAPTGSHFNTLKEKPKHLSPSDAKKIEALAYYGYGYEDKNTSHLDPKWYAITQYLIWQIESPEIEHYFVSSLTSSTPIYPYEKEIAELKKLVVEKTKNISFFDNDHSTHKIEKDTFIEIFDKNEVVGNYKYVFSETLKIYHLSYKSITFKAEQEGEHILTFKQSYDYYHKPYTYYVSDSYQDMLEPGDLDELVNTFVFNTEDIEETPEQPDDNLENNSDKEEIEKEENSSNGNIEENKEEENENIPPENLETDKKDEETNPQPDNSNTDDALKGEENKDETDDNVHEETENLDENIPDIKDDNFLTNLNGNTENSNSNYETIEATVPSTAANSFAIIYIFIIISSIILLKYAK